MAVPVGFFRNKNFTRNIRGALKVDAIFATDNAVGTDAFQGWLADNTVVTNFNDALIENNIGVVNTESFNVTLANRFAFTVMSEGRKLENREVVVARFANAIDPSLGTFAEGDVIEFVSNTVPFGGLDSPSNGKSYKIVGVVRERDLGIESVGASAQGADFRTITVDPREDLTKLDLSTNTGNAYVNGDTVVIRDVTETGTGTTFNQSFEISAVTANTFDIEIPSANTYNFGGIFFKASKDLILKEFIRAEVTGLPDFTVGVPTIDLSSGTIRGTIVIGQTVSGAGVAGGSLVTDYNSTTQQVTLSTNTTGVGDGTLNFEADIPSNVVIPVGATSAVGSATPFLFANAGAVTKSFTVKSPLSYYVFGDARLKYFWSNYNTDDVSLLNNRGWDENFITDNFDYSFVGGSTENGLKEQLITSEPVFAAEDTFNNVVNTLNINRGTGLSFSDDYSPSGRSALIYVGVTDSQGETGLAVTRNARRGSSVPAVSCTEAIDTINANNGYWVGVIGGSMFVGSNNFNCRNEIVTFREDTADGIIGDPRGFIPIKGEVVSLRVGAPIDSISWAAGVVTCTTLYDHKLGNVSDEIRIRIKNQAVVGDTTIEGLRDATVTGAKSFTFPLDVDPTISLGAFVNMGDYGYVINITDLLSVPKGFYRKSTLTYLNANTELNDLRTLADPPGVGLDRKDLLVTINISETTGTLQFFTDFPFGDFYVGLPQTTIAGKNYFAYPFDGRDIKFRVNVTNTNSNRFIDSVLLDPGKDEVEVNEIFSAILNPIEYTADITSGGIGDTTITIDNLQIVDSEFEGRDFASIDFTGGVAGEGYLNALDETTFTENTVTTTTSTGTGSGLTFKIFVTAGEITSAEIDGFGNGQYLPGDTGSIDQIAGSSTPPTVSATYTVNSLVGGELTIELSLNPDDTQDAGIPSLTKISTINSGSGSGPYSVDITNALTDNLVGREVSLIAPSKNARTVRIYVRPTNNFKDISVTPEAISEGLVDADSDIFITFAGYGYSENDVLTPTPVTNLPVSVSNATWEENTKIGLEGFTVSGQSIPGTESFIKTELNGTVGGTGAQFRVTQSPGGTYIVSILDQGSGFIPTEQIIIPGIELGDTEGLPTGVVILSDLSGDRGLGYTAGTESTTTTIGSGAGLQITFDVDGNGSILPESVVLDTSGVTSPYQPGDRGTINSTTATTLAEFEIASTTYDCTITVISIIDDSKATIETATPHNFTPPLGRNTVDISVFGVESTVLVGDGFNGFFSAEVTGPNTLVYNLSIDPGTYQTGGTVVNISVDVVNDTFAAFNEKLLFNINKPTNNPAYPDIKFISNATLVGSTVTVDVVDAQNNPLAHGFSNGDEVRISGIVSSRSAEWNIGKAEVTVVTSTSFSYDNPNLSGGGNDGIYVTGGEITNPFVKVIGGVYTKDFFRIVFVNTSNADIDLLDDSGTPVDVIPADKTKDIVVRDINFKQISNDGFEVTPGSEHDFFVLNNNTLGVPRRQMNMTKLEYFPATLEFEVTTDVDHRLFAGNQVVIDLTAELNPLAYGTPNITGSTERDIVSIVTSPTTFRYKRFREDAARDETITPVTQGDGSATIGSVDKEITDELIFKGQDGGVVQDIVEFRNLNAAAGISSVTPYYIVNKDLIGGSNNNENTITFQLARTKTGAPISFAVSVEDASYNRTTENAVIETIATQPHELLNGDEFNISGISSTAYNGTFIVSAVISPTIFTYSLPPVEGDSLVEASGTYTKTIIVGDSDDGLVDNGGSSDEKRCETVAANLSQIEIATNGSQDNSPDNLVPGMLIRNTGNTSAAWNQPDIFPPGTLIDSVSYPFINMTQSRDPAGSTVTGNNNRLTFLSNVSGAKCIGVVSTDGKLDLAPGQFIIGSGIPTATEIVSVYLTTDTDPTVTQPNIYALITISQALTADLISGNSVTILDNVTGSKTVRVQNTTEEPGVGSEIVNVDGSDVVQATIQTGTKVTDVTPTDTANEYIITLDTDILSDVQALTFFKFYPDSNPDVSSAVVSSKITTMDTGLAYDPATSDTIDDQETDFRGQVRLTSDVTGWDHVRLAQETGGGIFFQLGYSRLCRGDISSTTITAVGPEDFSDLAADNDGNVVGYGVYGFGIAPGATIASITNTTITLDTPNVGLVGGGSTGPGDYIGFSRPNSVSVFPKYTQEFGRILGKTFAEWLFKIA